ncbi:hypothetical protein CR513_32416, partial [Mucuna pruriens]
MARTNLSSTSLPLLILLMIAFTFIAQLTTASAGLSISLKYAKICTKAYQGWYINLVSYFNIHCKMARTGLSSMFVHFFILLVIVFTFFAQLTPVSAAMKMRKLGPLPSPPPPPTGNPPRTPRPFNIHQKMARTNLSSIFVPFLILLVIAFSFFAQLTPVSADMKMRKLGLKPSPPPTPWHPSPCHQPTL